MSAAPVAPGLVVALLSVGRHPVSGRPRRAERDARALSLALETGWPVVGLHAGAADDVPRDYLGMGAARILAVEVADGTDPVAALAGALVHAAPRLIVAGSRAETGEGSGLVPYLLAERLGLPLVPAAVSVRLAGDEAVVVQALPRGRRRELRVTGPLIATADEHGPALRQVARGPALRGSVERVVPDPAPAPAALSPVPLSVRPARARPKRIGPVSAVAAGGRTLVHPPAREAAAEILRFLEAERILAPPRPPKDPS